MNVSKEKLDNVRGELRDMVLVTMGLMGASHNLRSNRETVPPEFINAGFRLIFYLGAEVEKLLREVETDAAGGEAP